ncbi:ABL140Wp [Eremothecium gossypii ATCC 10895]|uniref:ABL140Wp n=1 Tax=Eremothecium gossypii (strain ATCC 10895 / CBS 109.51 / FGSC 9923 / NRRL Y-1056) TaxID=284811 RepID=Q75E13_EREGS|nr:ABL140Wp [Eremothecium gossypii ATCC 10895]AAS50631.2 ABL140Wp [Eremothecium gossypii ATCC 10895]
MPLNILGTLIFEGTDKIPFYPQIKRYAPYVAVIGGLKYWLRGRSNTWERNLHGKVYIVTGATSQGMGTSVVLDMARRGAQLVILTRSTDEWASEWCEQLREQSNNQLIYLEKCDLADLHQVRKFATTWLDNSPPRRLDGCIIMSGDIEPLGWPWARGIAPRRFSPYGVEIQVATNFAGTFHLLHLLQPSFKAQPPDRNVRIIVTTCFLQALGTANVEDPLWLKDSGLRSLRLFSSSKLQLSLCMLELQRRMFQDIKKTSKDGRSGKNISVTLVDPGLMRSSSLRRVVSNGSVWLLLMLYCGILYPIIWLIAKSGYRGAQVVLHALMSPELEEVNRADPESVLYLVDCQKAPFARSEFKDTELQKKLYDATVERIMALEKKVAAKRNIAKNTK